MEQNHKTKEAIKRIDHLIYKGVFNSKKDLCKAIDYKATSLSQVYSGSRNMPSDKVSRLEIIWKEYEKDSVSLVEEDRQNYGSQIIVTTVDNSGRDNIVLVDTKAQAGYLLGYEDAEFIKDLPSFNLPGLSQGTYRMFEVSGNSMLKSDGGLYPGDHVIGQWTELTSIRNDRVYIVVSKDEGVVVKRVSYKPEEKKLILKSDNKSGEYPPFAVNIQDIKEVWYVIKHLSNHITPPSDLYQRAISNEDKIIAQSDEITRLSKRVAHILTELAAQKELTLSHYEYFSDIIQSDNEEMDRLKERVNKLAALSGERSKSS